jgi:hypothetical protein
MAMPIILADNRFLDATPEATGAAADFPAANVADGRPYTFWMAPGPGDWTLAIQSPVAGFADCLAVIGHNLGSCGARVSVEYSADGVIWKTRLAQFTLGSDRAFMRVFTGNYALCWRLRIEGATVAPFIAVLVLGRRVEFPFPPDSPFIPYSESTVEDSANSKTGNALGTTVRYFPIDIVPTFTMIGRAWVEQVYRPFRAGYARHRKYFFWAWDLDAYPELVFFVKDVGKYDPAVSVLPWYDTLKLELQGVMEP